MTQTPAEALDILSRTIALVTFAENNGTLRTVLCTRSPTLIHFAGATEMMEKPTDRENNIAVFDLHTGERTEFSSDRLIDCREA